MERREAIFYVQLLDNKTRCELCGHNCLISDSMFGNCGVRRNIDGVLYSLNYGKVSALMIDPIEKKPLYHFYPGSKTLSIALSGCNFKCDFCQNSDISQINDPSKIQGEKLNPEDIIKIAKAKNVNIISYTYTEPTVFYEFMIETAMLAKTAGMYNVVVSNGFMNPKPLKELIKFTDAFNIDLKSFRQPTYQKIIGGNLDIVLENLDTISKSSAWLEVTTLLVPDLNDSKEEIEDIARFVNALSPTVPWHISKFHPDYKRQSATETPQETLLTAYNIGKEIGLKYVYVGNVVDRKLSSTYCSKCNEEVIGREGLSVYIKDEMNSLKGKCKKCGKNIDGRF
ncbi:MAG TPA: AmmeMemoRadiSam system radical SAM enzyme [bacterium]|nr:AmmeMemoRadiSam system radical SAM enzyme [bacterium]